MKGQQCFRDVLPSAPALKPPSARDQMSAPTRTASSTNVFNRACIVCAMPNKFCTHYASTYSKAGTPTLATSGVYDSPPHAVMGLSTIPFVNQMERFTVGLHLHRTWHFRLSPVPFPTDPHFVQHAQPNLQYIRAVEV